MKKEIYSQLSKQEQKRLEEIADRFRLEGSLSIRHLEAIKELIDEAIEARYKRK